MSSTASIYWIRQDLRLHDNPALIASVKNGSIIPLYILDDVNSKDHKIGQAGRVWLHQSLKELDKQFQNKLVIAKGDPEEILIKICQLETINKIYWNRVYEPWVIKRDKKIKTNLNKLEIETYSFNSSLLWEPWNILKDDKTNYKVFTPYFRRGCLNAKEPRRPQEKPKSIIYFEVKKFRSLKLDDLHLLPRHNWKNKILKSWRIGEKAANTRLNQFIDTELDGYGS